jgi:hypothetical protein
MKGKREKGLEQIREELIGSRARVGGRMTTAEKERRGARADRTKASRVRGGRGIGVFTIYRVLFRARYF